MEPSNLRRKRGVLIAVGAVVVLITLIAVVLLVVRQPSQKDYQRAKDTQIGDLTAARTALRPAVNEYLAAFKKAYNESDSPEQASAAAKPQYDAYQQAAQKARTAMRALEDNRVSNNTDTGTAVQQLTHDYDAEITYFTGLVESYPEYTVLFSNKQKQCSGIFVGATTSLTDRKQKLDAAATSCYAALSKLKQSANTTYVDYAKKIERRVGQMQRYAATVVQTEKTNKDFEAQAAVFQQRYAEATARGASDDELYKLADEIKQFNVKIDENKAEFDYASSRYLSTVKEIPTLFENVYSKDVPAKLKNFEQLHDIRTKVLTLLLEGKLAG